MQADLISESSSLTRRKLDIAASPAASAPGLLWSRRRRPLHHLHPSHTRYTITPKMRQASAKLATRAATRPLVRPAVAPLAVRAAQVGGQRTLFGLFGGSKKKAPAVRFDKVAEPEPAKPVLSQDDLFHPLSKSPFEPLRQKGERLRTYAVCPTSLEKYGERKPVRYECPDCGFPTHASQERYEEGKAEHAEYCPRLREVNEDEHDIRSGRKLVEFENMPGEWIVEPRVAVIAKFCARELTHRCSAVRAGAVDGELGHVLLHARLCVDQFAPCDPTCVQAADVPDLGALRSAPERTVPPLERPCDAGRPALDGRVPLHPPPSSGNVD